VVFRDRAAGREIEYPRLLAASGKRLRLDDVEVVAGLGAVQFNRKRFGATARHAARAASPLAAKGQVDVRDPSRGQSITLTFLGAAIAAACPSAARWSLNLLNKLGYVMPPRLSGARSI